MKMLDKKLLYVLAIFLFTSATAYAEEQYAYRISFFNKDGGTATLAAPLEYLSARALERRTALGIAIDSADLPVPAVYINEILTLTGGKLHVTSRWFNQCVVLVSNPADMAGVGELPFVSGTALVGYFSSGLHMAVPSAAELAEAASEEIRSTQRTAADASDYGASWGQTNLVQGAALHDAGFRGQGKLIAFLDEGYSGIGTHPGFDSMRNNGRLIEQHNFVRNNDVVDDYSQHGMKALSTAAGYMQGTYIGSAPLASYAVYITEIQGSESQLELDNMVAGMERADSLGADVVSASLGYNTFNNPDISSFAKSDLDGHTTLAARGANMAVQKGMIFVTAAGNEGGNSWNFLITPGDADSAITVGMVANDMTPGAQSSPGFVEGGKVKPDVCLQGTPAVVFTGSGGTSAENGTSYAAPQLAGYAACLLQAAAPGTRPRVIRDAINKSAHMYAAPTPKMGHGVPDFSAALASLAIPDGPSGAAAVQVWPNPLGAILNIRLDTMTDKALSLSLYDMQGRIVWSYAAQNLSGNTASIPAPSGLATGLYMLRGNTSGRQFTEKVWVR